MATRLPGLIIKIGAETRDAVQGLNRVNNAMGKTLTRGQRFTSTMRKAGPAIAAAGAAAAAAAVAFGVDAAKAFAEDQKEVDLLNKQLENLGFDKATESVGKWVDALQYSANVADTDIRKAFQTLVRGTRDVEEAQRATELALDISALTGKDLTQVAEALGQAYLGNTQALSRLKIGLDKTTLASGDTQKIMERLRDTMGGGAATRANTLEGAIAGVQLQWEDLKESFGRGLVTGGGDTIQELQDAETQLKDMGQAAETTGNVTNKALGQTADSINRISRIGQEFAAGDWFGAFQALTAWATMGVSEATFGSHLADQIDEVASAADLATGIIERYLRAQGKLVGGVQATPNNTMDGWQAALYGPQSSGKGQRNPNRIGIENERRARQRRRERRQAAADARARARQQRRANARTGINYSGDARGVRPW